MRPTLLDVFPMPTGMFHTWVDDLTAIDPSYLSPKQHRVIFLVGIGILTSPVSLCLDLI